MQVLLNESDYARIERERRWCAAELPASLPASTRRTQILDHYVIDTRLRLRKIKSDTDLFEYKFGLKELVNPGDFSHAWMTNLYLTETEYEKLSVLPSHVLKKTRYRVRTDEAVRVAIDVFESALAGLIIIEAEFDNDESMNAFKAPDWFGAEVTGDPRYTGASLARTGKIPG
jgi:CYTH domain-containing protein